MGDELPAAGEPMLFFVSYTDFDREWAQWIAWQLEDAGYRVRIKAWDFGAGAHFVHEMHRAAQEAARTVAVLSAAYLSSAYGEAEWQAAWAADPRGEQRKLLVVRVEDCDRPGLLRQLVGVDLFDAKNPEEARGRLLAAARGGRGKPAAEPAFPHARLAGRGGFWPRRRPDRLSDLAGVADKLAVAVRRQWEDEAALRRLSDPYPLPVRWVPADPDLVDDWATVQRLASTGPGWPPPGGWAAGPAELAGGDRQLVECLERVPTGRLVVLGEPGAGKTTLAVRLVLDFLARRVSGEPVPLLVPLASWDPAEQDLYGWLERRLAIDHPGLREPAPGRPGVSRGRALLDEGLILMVLDGLDEIPDAVRGQAIAQVNEALRPGQQMVLLSRDQPYRAATRPPGGIEVTLTGAAGIQLCPVEAGAVADYLRDSAGGTDSAARWDPVLETPTTMSPPPVAYALTTPLTVSLTRTIYNPRPGERVGAPPDPAELLDPARFPTRRQVEEHLFDGFLPAAYRPHPDPARRCPWQAADAERWLVFLARHLEHTLHGTPDFAWWLLPHSLSPRRRWLPRVGGGLAGALVVGLVLGLAGGLWLGIGFGLTYGLIAGLAFDWEGSAPMRAVRFRIARIRALVHGSWWGLLVGLNFVPTAGLVVGLVAVVFMSLEAAPADLTAAVSPRAVLARDRATFRSLALVVGLVVGLPVGVVGGFPVGIVAGLGAGGVAGLYLAAWGSFAISHVSLALRGRLPWRLMAFLADAHERGVLRQVGAVYQFRHLELQRRLAGQPTSTTTAATTTAATAASVDVVGALASIRVDGNLYHLLFGPRYDLLILTTGLVFLPGNRPGNRSGFSRRRLENLVENVESGRSLPSGSRHVAYEDIYTAKVLHRTRAKILFTLGDGTTVKVVETIGAGRLGGSREMLREIADHIRTASLPTQGHTDVVDHHARRGRGKYSVMAWGARTSGQVSRGAGPKIPRVGRLLTGRGTMFVLCGAALLAGSCAGVAANLASTDPVVWLFSSFAAIGVLLSGLGLARRWGRWQKRAGNGWKVTGVAWALLTLGGFAYNLQERQLSVRTPVHLAVAAILFAVGVVMARRAKPTSSIVGDNGRQDNHRFGGPQHEGVEGRRTPSARRVTRLTTWQRPAHAVHDQSGPPVPAGTRQSRGDKV